MAAKERTLVELATAIDLGDNEIAAAKAVIQRKETEVLRHKSDLASPGALQAQAPGQKEDTFAKEN